MAFLDFQTSINLAVIVCLPSVGPNHHCVIYLALSACLPAALPLAMEDMLANVTNLLLDQLVASFGNVKFHLTTLPKY